MTRRAALFGLALVAAALFYGRATGPVLTLAVMDIGQGDAILLRTPGGFDALVDAGPDARSVAELSRLLPTGDRTLELVVITHPHADHLTGILSVLTHFAVDRVWTSGVTYDAPIARAMKKAFASHHVPEFAVHSGQRTDIGDGVTLEVLWPRPETNGTVVTNDNAANGGGLNDDSVVLRLTYGTFCAYLMGDASQAVESALLASQAVTPCPILKVGHHGSRFSSTAPFLAAVHSADALVSVGKNHYGHPHPAALRRLSHANANILRTDQHGTIRVTVQPNGHYAIRTDR